RVVARSTAATPATARRARTGPPENAATATPVGTPRAWARKAASGAFPGAALEDRERLHRVGRREERVALLPALGDVVDPRAVGALERDDDRRDLLAPVVGLAVGVGHGRGLAGRLLVLGERPRHREQVVVVAL